MTYVQANLMGRYGNQLFQYWVARYIADKLNWPLKINVGCGTFFLCTDVFPQLRLPSSDNIMFGQPTSPVTEPAHEIDIENVINEHRNTEQPVHICKFIENSKIIIAYESYIRDLYYHVSLPCYSDITNRIVIHMRLGDIGNYWDGFGQTYTEFAVKIAQAHPYLPCLIVSEEPCHTHTHHMLSILQKSDINATIHTPKYSDNHIQDDFDTMASAKILVATNSTFSWWAGFLNRHPNTKKYLAISEKQFASAPRRKYLMEHMATVPGWSVYDLDTQTWL